jgi:tetratricopeptide (TPR) repeat protein
MPGQDFIKLITDQAEFLKSFTPLLAALVPFIGGGGVIGVLLLWLKHRQQKLKQKRQQELPSGDFPFEIISPNTSTVLKQLMSGSNDDDPLADANIPYLQRQPNRNIRQELERAFEAKPWVLILGRTGLGKTREAAQLAKLLNDEGWTILNLADQAGAWIDEPRQFPPEISPNAKLLFFLDDLNRWVYRGKPREISKDADDPAQPLRVSVQERLLRTLEFYERECRNQVRVIATARNERDRHPDRLHELSEFEKLQFEQYPNFWNRFEPYELVEPSDAAIVELLSDRVEAAHLRAKVDEFPQIASRNDRTFRNIVENLRTATNRELVVSVNELSETLDRTWRVRYKAALKRYPTAQYTYDAVEVLQTLNLLLTPAMVGATAELFIHQRGVKWIWKQWQLRQALKFLIESEKILEPRDGQIEAKNQHIDVKQFVPLVLKKLVTVGERYYSQNLLAAEFLDCGMVLNDLELYEDAIRSFDEVIKYEPDNIDAWYFRGTALNDLERYEDAIASFDRAIQHKPEDHHSWYLRGMVLIHLKRYEDAIVSFDEAIKYEPEHYYSWHFRGIALVNLGRYEDAVTSLDKAIKYESDSYYSWHFRGNALANLGRYEDAVTSFDEAIKYDPNYYYSWHFRGMVFISLGRCEDAVTSFDEAIKYDPNYYYSWHFHGIALTNLGRYEDAVTSFDQALKYDPNYYYSWNVRGNALRKLNRYGEAIASYDEALKHKPDYHVAWFNRASFYALQGNAELAIENLKISIDFSSECLEKAKTHSDFACIRNDDRFQALINEHQNG